MSWRERQVTAGFRGFKFLTEAHQARGGRRLAVTPLPGAEEPVVKDLGGEPWNWKLNCYFIGEDYDEVADRFLLALNVPGPDWLDHPWLHRKWVCVKEFTREESNAEGGMCKITIEFVPGGDERPMADPDQVDQASSSIDDMSDAAVDDFSLENLSADSMNAMIANVQEKLEYLRSAISLASLPLTWASQVMNVIQGVKGDLNVLLSMPGRYAAAMRSLFNVLGGASGGDDGSVPPSARPRLAAAYARLATAPTNSTLTGVAAADPALRRNLQNEAKLRGRLMLAATAEVALVDYQAEEDRDAALASVETAVDALLPTLPDSVFQAAVTMRTAVTIALQAQDLKPTVTRDVVRPLPAVVLAYRLQVDRDTFIARNRVRHPLFVNGRVIG